MKKKTGRGAGRRHKRKILAAQLTFRLGVSETDLQAAGLALPDSWGQPCFSSTNNRVVLLDGGIVAAVVTLADHEAASDPSASARHAASVEEIVAIEVLPRFRKRGIAGAIVRSFLRDGRVRLNSPNEEMTRVAAGIGVLTEVDVGIVEVSARA